MLIGITLVTLGYSKAKRIEESAKKYKTILTYFGIGLVIIFVMIPWPFMKEFGSWI
jgi:lauroyl/myristoyl acyltransferase